MSIRLRLSTLFTLATALLFSAGAWLFVAELSSGLLRQLDSQLQASVAQASRVATSHTLSGTGVALPGEYVIQIFDSAGHIQSATPDSRDTPLLTTAQLRSATAGSIVMTSTIDGEAERVAAGPFPAHPGWVAAAGTPLESFDGTMNDVKRGLVISGIVVVVFAAAAAYGLARASLAPVERLRREVASLSEGGRGVSVEVPQTHDELEALAETMNELLSRLHEALARQRAFVADAGHELRTPFAILQAELELASRPGRDNLELTTALSRASEEAGRLTRLANDLLVLARSDDQQLEVRRTQVQVRALLSESTDAFARRAGETHVTLRVQARPDLTVAVDPDRIRQAVDNLLDNAVRFSPEGSTVTVRGVAEGTDARIEVEDSGPGFPSDYLPKAFERFSRPDSGRGRRGGGAGLGLAIVQAIAVAHGGKATAANWPEGGAVVGIELPGAAVTT
jgi:two-component system OmpR family sensor kinase